MIIDGNICLYIRQGNYTYDFVRGEYRKGEYRKQTTDVGKYPANLFGLYDMSGNVWEWCMDEWHENYNNAPTDGSAWLSDNDNPRRCVRGGSWGYNNIYCLSASRMTYYWVVNDHFVNDIGFRVACDVGRILK